MSSDADRNRPPLISVAICTRNRARLLSGAVESVLSQLDTKTQLTIIDNGSTDDTPALLAGFARRNPMVRSYQEPRLGIGHARNSAMVNSPGDWVLFLDDDDTAEAGWLAAYRSFLESPPSANIAVVGGRIIPNYETTPPRWWTKGDGGLDLGPLPRRFESRAGPWSCNAAYRRDAVQKIGGFNPSLGRKGAFYGAHEESDVYIRLLEAGYEAWYLPEARILHLIQAERLRAAWHCRTEYAQGRSAAIMRGARYPSPTSHLFFSLRHTVVGVLHIILLILATVVTLPFGHGRRSIRSLTRALRKAGFIRQLWANQFNPERRL